MIVVLPQTLRIGATIPVLLINSESGVTKFYSLKFKKEKKLVVLLETIEYYFCHHYKLEVVTLVPLWYGENSSYKRQVISF